MNNKENYCEPVNQENISSGNLSAGKSDSPQAVKRTVTAPSVSPIVSEGRNPGLNEVILAAVMYIVSYLYTAGLVDTYASGINTLIMFLTIVIGTESLNKSTKPSTGSYIILGCFALTVISYVLSSFRVAETVLFKVFSLDELYEFIHIFAVWYVLTRSGFLVSGSNSRYVLMDIANGFVVVPFSNFLKRIKAIIFGLKRKSPEKKKINLFYILIAIVLCAALFLYAASLLGASDEIFGKIIEKIKESINFNIEVGEFIFRLILSLPVGAYLFGIMVGSAKTDKSLLISQKSGIDRFIESIKKVPTKLFVIVVVAFSVMYIVYFCIQGTYLFGAFTGNLPEDFLPAQYARQGFFELCKVVAVNFAVVYLTTRMSEGTDDGKIVKVSAIVILAESLLFAVIAISKLALYISIFGFTPRRVISTWFTTILLSGCVLWIVNLVRGKECFKYWLYYGAISLAAICVY